MIKASFILVIQYKLQEKLFLPLISVRTRSAGTQVPELSCETTRWYLSIVEKVSKQNTKSMTGKNINNISLVQLLAVGFTLFYL